MDQSVNVVGGQGVVIDRQGLVLTNAHVVDQVDAVNVTLANGDQRDGEVIGRDPVTDLALVRLKGTAMPPSARLGDSRSPRSRRLGDRAWNSIWSGANGHSWDREQPAPQHQQPWLFG